MSHLNLKCNNLYVTYALDAYTHYRPRLIFKKS